MRNAASNIAQLNIAEKAFTAAECLLWKLYPERQSCAACLCWQGVGGSSHKTSASPLTQCEASSIAWCHSDIMPGQVSAYLHEHSHHDSMHGSSNLSSKPSDQHAGCRTAYLCSSAAPADLRGPADTHLQNPSTDLSAHQMVSAARLICTYVRPGARQTSRRRSDWLQFRIHYTANLG